MVWLNSFICVVSLCSFIFFPHIDPDINTRGAARMGLFFLTVATGSVNLCVRNPGNKYVFEKDD